jgi:methionyl-tRNA formyltransferase
MEDRDIIKNKIKYAFWGTGPVAESALYAIHKNNLEITRNKKNSKELSLEYIFTKPDAIVGREKTLTAPMIKTWGESKSIKVIQPSRLKPSLEDLDINNPDNKIDGYNLLKEILRNLDVCVVASYGKIIPKELLELPKYGFINLHPSDLPEYRGPSPIESQLLDNYKELVISIMKLDSGMDSGDILIKNKIEISELDTAQSLELKAGQVGGELIANILPDYIDNNIKLQKQDDDKKTVCTFIKKEDGEIKLTDNLQEIKNKWRAYYGWPGIFFFLKHIVHDEEKIIRIKISGFNLKENSLDKCILRVIPEGKKEISFDDFKRGYLENN